MSEVIVAGYGAVSPAGWGVPAFRAAVQSGQPIPLQDLARPGTSAPLRVRSVPAPLVRPSALSHPRLRRVSPISNFAAAAALEALGQNPAGTLGLVLCVTCGCVLYSRRFYSEVLKDPATASPLVFPETVFNAPAGHLCTLLGTTAPTYTFVGDHGTFLQGLAFGAQRVAAGELDGCLVVGAEEIDWLVAHGLRLLDPELALSEGAGAVYLRRGEALGAGPALVAVSSPQTYTRAQPKLRAARRVKDEICAASPADLLCDGLQGSGRTDRVETAAWDSWTGPRISVRRILGEGLMAAAAWQCVAALDALQSGLHSAALVSLVGSDQQAIAALFKSKGPDS